MSAIALVEQGYRVETTGTKATVPDDSMAKLMYYLSIVKTCLNTDKIPSRLMDYSRYYSLSSDEKAVVVGLCVIFNPTIFLGKIIIIVEANNPLLEGFSNNFIKITEATRVRAIAQVEEYVALADGTRVQAVEIVIVTENWLQKNFLTPIESEKWRLQAGSTIKPTPTYTSYTRTTTTYASPSSSRPACLSFWYWIFTFFGLCSGAAILASYTILLNALRLALFSIHWTIYLALVVGSLLVSTSLLGCCNKKNYSVLRACTAFSFLALAGLSVVLASIYFPYGDYETNWYNSSYRQRADQENNYNCRGYNDPFDYPAQNSTGSVLGCRLFLTSSVISEMRVVWLVDCCSVGLSFFLVVMLGWMTFYVKKYE